MSDVSQPAGQDVEVRWALLKALWVSGDPKPQPRPRAFARHGNARVYDPATAEGWKSTIATAIKDHIPDTPLECPIRIDIDFFFKRPGRLMRKRDPDGPVLHVSTPDRDNLEKAVLDCLKTLSFFRDDSQVCDGRVRKAYHSKRGRPGMNIMIRIPEEQRDVYGLGV